MDAGKKLAELLERLEGHLKRALVEVMEQVATIAQAIGEAEAEAPGASPEDVKRLEVVRARLDCLDPVKGSTLSAQDVEDLQDRPQKAREAPKPKEADKGHGKARG